MPWPASPRPRRKAFSRRWRPNPQATRKWKTYFGWSSCIPNFKSYAKHHESSRIHHPQRSSSNWAWLPQPRSCDRRNEGLGQRGGQASGGQGRLLHPDLVGRGMVGRPTPSIRKRYHPYEVGLDMSKILSTFPAIDTNADGLKITKGLENIARVMDRGTLIRSAFQSGFGLDPSFPPSIPLAYRIRPAPDRGGSPLGSMDGQGARSEQRDRSAVHQYRPASRGGWAKRRS